MLEPHDHIAGELAQALNKLNADVEAAGLVLLTTGVDYGGGVWRAMYRIKDEYSGRVVAGVEYLEDNGCWSAVMYT